MKKVKSIFAVLALLFICSSHIACSSSPSEAEIKKELSQFLNQPVEFVEVTNFKKISGSQSGKEEYIADVEYDIQFTKGMQEALTELESKLADANREPGPLGELGSVGFLMYRFGHFTAGQRHHLNERVHLIKIEEGWRFKLKE